MFIFNSVSGFSDTAIGCLKLFNMPYYGGVCRDFFRILQLTSIRYFFSPLGAKKSKHEISRTSLALSV